MMAAIKATTWAESGETLKQIRHQVFVDEQGVPPELEVDEHDPEAQHWLALVNGKAVGTVRLLKDGHIGRMAVLAEYRHQGLGKALLDAATLAARQSGVYEVYLYAQITAADFYRRAGFTGNNDTFIDAGIEHTTLRKPLASQRLLGIHGGKFAVTDMAASALQLAQQAQRQLRILSLELDPCIFDSEAMSDALSALARRHRNCEVQILVLNSKPLAQRGHRLLKLHRRLPSAIQIRKPNCKPEDLKEAVIIADRSGLLVQSIREPEKCWGNFNNQPVAVDYAAQFDELWYRSSIDPELRTLNI